MIRRSNGIMLRCSKCIESTGYQKSSVIYAASASSCPANALVTKKIRLWCNRLPTSVNTKARSHTCDCTHKKLSKSVRLASRQAGLGRVKARTHHLKRAWPSLPPQSWPYRAARNSGTPSEIISLTAALSNARPDEQGRLLSFATMICVSSTLITSSTVKNGKLVFPVRSPVTVVGSRFNPSGSAISIIGSPALFRLGSPSSL